MQFQVSFALLAMVVCFAAAETKTSSSAQSDADRGKREVFAPLVASPYVAPTYAAAAPYVAASPYVAARYAAAPYAAAVASPYFSSYSAYSGYPYVAKTLTSPYTAAYYV